MFCYVCLANISTASCSCTHLHAILKHFSLIQGCGPTERYCHPIETRCYYDLKKKKKGKKAFSLFLYFLSSAVLINIRSTTERICISQGVLAGDCSLPVTCDHWTQVILQTSRSWYSLSVSFFISVAVKIGSVFSIDGPDDWKPVFIPPEICREEWQRDWALSVCVWVYFYIYISLSVLFSCCTWAPPPLAVTSS